MVVSSVTPLISAAILVQRSLLSASEALSTSKMTFCSWLVGGGRVGRDAGLLGLEAEVDEQGGVATVVEDHVGERAAGPVEDLLGAPPVLLQRLALPGEDRDAGGGVDGALGPTATAAAAWSWVEKMLQEAQRTSAPSATSVSMRTAVWMVMCSEPAMRAPASGLLVAVALAHRHQAGHLVLGERDLGAAEVGQGEVGDLEVHRVLLVNGGVRSAPRICALTGSPALTGKSRTRLPGGILDEPVHAGAATQRAATAASATASVGRGFLHGDRDLVGLRGRLGSRTAP